MAQFNTEDGYTHIVAMDDGSILTAAALMLNATKSIARGAILNQADNGYVLVWKEGPTDWAKAVAATCTARKYAIEASECGKALRFTNLS